MNGIPNSSIVFLKLQFFLSVHMGVFGDIYLLDSRWWYHLQTKLLFFSSQVDWISKFHTHPETVLGAQGT